MFNHPRTGGRLLLHLVFYPTCNYWETWLIFYIFYISSLWNISFAFNFVPGCVYKWVCAGECRCPQKLESLRSSWSSELSSLGAGNWAQFLARVVPSLNCWAGSPSLFFFCLSWEPMPSLVEEWSLGKAETITRLLRSICYHTKTFISHMENRDRVYKGTMEMGSYWTQIFMFAVQKDGSPFQAERLLTHLV